VDPGLIILIAFILLPLLERLFRLGRPPREPPDEQLPPGQRRPGQRPPAQQRPRRQPMEEQEERPFRSIPSADAEEQSAATMLPDDLWEILTGEKRSPAPPRPVERPPAEPAEYEAPHPPPPQPVPRSIERRPAEAQRRRETPTPSRERVPTPSREHIPTPSRERAPTSMRERRLPPVPMRTPRGQPVPAARRTPLSPPDDYVPVHEAPVVVSYETGLMDPEERQARFHERLAESAIPAGVIRPARSDEYRLRGPADVRRAVVMAEILGPPKGLQD
jgi:hypothetical protein